MSKYLIVFLCFICLISPFADKHKIVTINVMPDQKVLQPGETCRFVAQGYNRHYEEVNFHPEWATSGGGHITPDGLFTAGMNSGIYFVRAIYRPSGAEGSAVVTIKGKHTSSTELVPASSKIVKIELTPANIRLKPGQSVRFQINSYNAFGQHMPLNFRPQWRPTGGAISPDGTYKAGGAPGTYIVYVSDPNHIWTAEAKVYIDGPIGRIAHVRITPQTSTIKPYEEVRFFATAYDSSGNPVSTQCFWECTGGGYIDSNGIFKATNSPGTHTIKVRTTEGVTSSATVFIESFQLSRIEILPSPTSFVAGQVAQFKANVYDSNNQLTNADILWSAGGGVMQPNGVFKAGNFSGRYMVTASSGKLTASVPIEIHANLNRIVRIEILPNDVNLIPGQSIAFHIKAYSSQGQSMSVPAVRWTARGGTMTSDGLYQAGNNFGKFVLEAHTMDNLEARAWISINPPSQYQPYYPPHYQQPQQPQGSNYYYLIVTPEKMQIRPGQKAKFQAEVRDSNNRIVQYPITWEATGGMINQNGEFIAGETLGSFYVKAWDKEHNLVRQAEVIVIGSPSEISQIPVMPPTPPNPIEPNPIHIIKWRTGHGGSNWGDIEIQGRVFTHNASKIKLVVENIYGQEEVLTQVFVPSHGARFDFMGKYVRSTTQAVKVVLYDKQDVKIYEFRRAVR